MDFLLHRQKFRGHVMKTPIGLQELMADISREVLRRQPQDVCVYKFIADYLKSMVATREESMAIKEIIDLALCRVFATLPNWDSVGVPLEKSRSMESMMEASFRHFVDKKRSLIGDNDALGIYEEDLFDHLIQQCNLSYEEAKRSRPVIQEAFKEFLASYLGAVQGKTTEEMLKNPLLSGTAKAKICQFPSKEKLESAAVIIQSNYKGYKTRKTLPGWTKPFRKEPLYKCIDKSEAAVRIQSLYRGYKTRRSLEQLVTSAPASLDIERQTQANSIRKIERERLEKDIQKRIKALGKEEEPKRKCGGGPSTDPENEIEVVFQEAMLEKDENDFKVISIDEREHGVIDFVEVLPDSDSQQPIEEFIADKDSDDEDDEQPWRNMVDPHNVDLYSDDDDSI